MTTAIVDSLRVEIVKKFNNNNILLYLQELVGITNKTAMQKSYEYCRVLWTATQKNKNH